MLLTAQDVDDGVAPLAHTFVLPSSGAPDELSAVASAEVVDGVAPALVHLTANLAGGVAPHRVSWLSGDGLSMAGVVAESSGPFVVEHLYGDHEGGSYLAVVDVLDSMGTSVRASVGVDVAAAADVDARDAGSPDPAPDAGTPDADEADAGVTEPEQPAGRKRRDGDLSPPGCGCAAGGLAGADTAVVLSVVLLLRRGRRSQG